MIEKGCRDTKDSGIRGWEESGKEGEIFVPQRLNGLHLESDIIPLLMSDDPLVTVSPIKGETENANPP
jgi:hypothetical protein